MEIARLRLANQFITGPQLSTPEDVVRSLVAVQAQDYHQALWAIGLRIPGSDIPTVEAALDRRAVIRSWGMRGTLHFIMAEDAGWMRRLFAPRILARTTAKEWDYHATDRAMMDRAAELFTSALSGGRTLRRDQMIALLADDGIPDDRQQSYFMFAYLSQTGLLCLGPVDGGTQTFALLEEWAPDQRQLSEDESLAELAYRFFISHGPATLADFVNWSGLPMGQARSGLDHVVGQLHRESVDGTDYFLSGNTAEGSGSFLLPAYDEFTIGYRDRSQLFQTYGAFPISTYNGMFYATIVLDGQIAGLWKRTVARRQVTVELRPLEGVDPSPVVPHAERLAAFHGLPLRRKDGSPPELEMAKATWGKRAQK